ncbi:MAG: MBG domain-containing protein, partial [Verrucomicrobiota bacterium]
PGNKLGNYSITNVSGTITITKAPLGVTADNKSRAYGTTNPILTVSYNGFVNSETYTTLGASLSLTTEATTASPAGTYTITASGYTSANYAISYTNGILIVGSATLTVSGDNKTRVYGEANPALTGSLVGVVSDDSISAAWSTATTNNSVVGTYAITPVWTDPDGKLANYIITTNLGTMTITKAVLRVTADNQSRSYGDDNPVLTISYNGFAEGDTASSLTTQPICNVSATLSTIPGTYTITASGASSSNYTITYVNGTLTVGKALLVIIGDDATRSYGRTNPVFTASIVGIKNGDNLTFDYYTEATTRSLPGKYYIEIRIGGGDGKIVNYEVLMVGGRVTVNPAVLTGTIGSQSRGYGQNNSPFTLVYSGFVYPEDTNLITGTVTLAAKTGGGATVTLATAPGTYAIKATAQQSLANYTVSYVDGTLAVTQVELMVTGNNATRVYGSSNPTLTASTAGFVNNETVSVLGGSLSVNSPATVTSSAGSHKVTPSGCTSVNYAIRYVDGALTVTKAPLAGEITSSARAYGRSNTAYAVTYTGWLNGDTTNVLGSGPGFSCVDTNTTIDITNNTPIGSYVVKAVGAPAATNYSITIADGTLAITQAVLTATADNGSRTYGASNPGLTGTLTGVVDGDNITAIYGTTAIETSPAGRYDIVPGLVDPGGKLTNYLASITSGTLNINKAALVVAADNQSRAYGASNPTLSVGYSGFVNGDSATTLGGTLSMSTPAAASSPIGTYAITASGQTSANYHISYTGGTLTVGKGTMVATADNLSRTYGAANPVLTGTLTGMVPWDNITVSYSTIATQAIGVGAYAIVTTLSDPDGKLENYNVTRSDGTFTVNKASLVARADNLSRTYGSLNPHLTQRYTGFLNGEDSLVLTTIPTLETTATTMSPVGTYEITMTGGSAANYEITRTSGTLAINRAAITVVADNKIRTYGTANPSLTGTLSGVLNGDNITAFYGTTATISSPAGTYAIVPGLLDLTSKLGNYTTTLTNGVLTVKGDDAPVVTLTGYPWLNTVGTAASLVDTNATVTDGG